MQDFHAGVYEPSTSLLFLQLTRDSKDLNFRHLSFTSLASTAQKV